jgi:UV DNA damage endonuclease
MNRIGYCCLSQFINEDKRKKDHIMVNRGMVKKTFILKGLSYASELIILNLKDTLKVLDFNITNNIYVYRLSSDSFPWMSEYEFSDLPNFNVIEKLMKSIGDKIKSNNMRCSYHPGPFNVLASENPLVVTKTINELNKHAELMDLLGLDKTTFYPINIHINTTKPTRELAAERFCKEFENLSDSCKARLVVENDDSLNQYSVQMLYNMVYKVIGIPITVDSLHYQCHPDDMSWEDTLRLGTSTWKTKPMTHHSSSKKLHEDSSSKLIAHADFLYEKFESFDIELDIEIEAKAKDIAVIRYRKEFETLVIS